MQTTIPVVKQIDPPQQGEMFDELLAPRYEAITPRHDLSPATQLAIDAVRDQIRANRLKTPPEPKPRMGY